MVDPASALDAAAWTLAALISTLRDAATAPLADVLAAAPQRTAVLEAVGLVDRKDDGFTVHPSLHLGQPLAEWMLSSLRQAVSAATRDGNGTVSGGWALQHDEVLLGHGRASAATGRALATKIVPELTGLARLNVAGSRVLDVGTGVAAIAVTLAREFPALMSSESTFWTARWISPGRSWPTPRTSPAACPCASWTLPISPSKPATT